jgi:hypothetical protein
LEFAGWYLTAQEKGAGMIDSMPEFDQHLTNTLPRRQRAPTAWAADDVWMIMTAFDQYLISI